MVGRLSGLEELKLPSNGLVKLPAGIGRLGTLRRLDLSHNRLSSLPPRIGELAGLEELILDDNRLTALPPEIGRLVALQALSAVGNELRNLPRELALLKELRQLNLGKNKLAELPAVVGRLSGLEELKLPNNSLVKLPAGIGRLGTLRRLDVSDNTLAGLPEEVGKLQRLEELDLHRNQLDSLPPWLGQLRYLQNLNLAGNRIDELPDELDWLAKLRSLDLRDTPLASGGDALAEAILTQVNNPGAILQACQDKQGRTTRSANFADLEVSLYRRDTLVVNDSTSYGLELRFTEAKGETEKIVSGSMPVRFDPGELLQRELDPTAYGAHLAGQLLAEPALRAFFDRALAAAQARSATLRIRLHIRPDSVELHSLHWETLRLSQESAPLLMDERLVFSRYLSSPDSRPVPRDPKENSGR